MPVEPRHDGENPVPQRKRRSLLMLGGVLSAVAAGLSLAVAFGALGADGPTGNPGTKTIQVGSGRATPAEAAQVASRGAGFPVRVPSEFATSATELSQITYDTAQAIALRRVNVRLSSPMRKVTASGFEYYDTVNILESAPGLEIIPGGDPFPIPLAGAQVWKEAVPPHPQVIGQPQRFTYHVILPGGVTYTMGFIGEQPSPEGLAKMLQTMR